MITRPSSFIQSHNNSHTNSREGHILISIQVGTLRLCELVKENVHTYWVRFLYKGVKEGEKPKIIIVFWSVFEAHYRQYTNAILERKMFSNNFWHSVFSVFPYRSMYYREWQTENTLTKLTTMQKMQNLNQVQPGAALESASAGASQNTNLPYCLQ